MLLHGKCQPFLNLPPLFPLAKLTDCMNSASMLSNRNNKRKILSTPGLNREKPFAMGGHASEPLRE
jgi:hypothetical protein